MKLFYLYVKRTKSYLKLFVDFFMKTIKILGGGIAGLTTAINLKRAGIDTEVYEIKNYCDQNMIYCTDYCRNINSTHEICSQLMNSSFQRGRPQ